MDRVFEVLDNDNSNSIEWEEFVEAMSALEKGSRECKTRFLFQVYDRDNDGCISKDELAEFFLSSLMVKPDQSILDVTEDFVERTFHEVHTEINCRSEANILNVEDVLLYLESRPDVTDVYGLFGRSMTGDDVAKFQKGRDDIEEEQGTFLPMVLTKKVRSNRRKNMLAKFKSMAKMAKLGRGASKRNTDWMAQAGSVGGGGDGRSAATLLRQSSLSGVTGALHDQSARRRLASPPTPPKLGKPKQKNVVTWDGIPG